MGVNFNEINKFKSQIEFDKERDNKSLTISSINKSEISETNIRLSNDDPRRREYSDDGFEEAFDIAKEPYRQEKK